MANSCLMRVMLLIFICTGLQSNLLAQAAPIEHLWYNEEKSAKIKIYKAENGLYFGKIVWLKIPNINGQPKVDAHNPDADKQNAPIMGLLILKDFKKTGENIYDDGTVYDPKNGKNYSCTLTQNGDTLNVHGYIGISLIGRTTIWTKAEDN